MQAAMLPLPLQDENAMATPRGKMAPSGGASFRSFGTPMGGKSAAPPSARKALGNITNKAAPTPGTSRKAFGDITNATPNAKEGGVRMDGVKLFTKTPKAVRAVETTKQKADRYAEDGIEGYAGKSWAELDADRLRREDEEIAEKAAAARSFRADLPPFFSSAAGKLGGAWDVMETDQAGLECPGGWGDYSTPGGGADPFDDDLLGDVGPPGDDLLCREELNFELAGEDENDLF